MSNNRRSFFKGLATFASGVVAAKAATYIPKKEEKKETVFVPSNLTIYHEGAAFHPLVVKKTPSDTVKAQSQSIATSTNGEFLTVMNVSAIKQTIREANI